MAKKFSIIIQTFNHCSDCLQPAIESILKYTDQSIIEIIIVSNGSTDGTDEYLKTLPKDIFTTLSFPEPLGYTRATNEGIKIANGEFVILFNNDNLLLPQPTNEWLNYLHKPFITDPKCAITGPLRLQDVYVNCGVIIFFCAMIPRRLFQELGLLDEIFSPGGCEDIDFTMKCINAGYTTHQVPSNEKAQFTETNTTIFMIWHKNNKTFGEIPEYSSHIIKRNGMVVLKRYNKNIKLNIGSGSIHLQHYGFISVDDKNPTADLVGDICEDLVFDDNSVSEIYCGHVINHCEDAVRFLETCYRILKPGGFIAVEMPDMWRLCEEYLKGNLERRQEVMKWLFDGYDIEWKKYSAMSGWDCESMKNLMEKIGFRNIMIGSEVMKRSGINFRCQGNK